MTEVLSRDMKVLARISCACEQMISFELDRESVGRSPGTAVVKIYHLDCRVSDYFVNGNRGRENAEYAAELLYRAGVRFEQVRKSRDRNHIFNRRGCGIEWYLVAVAALQEAAKNSSKTT